MSGAIPPLPQYASMVWCLVKTQGQLYLHLYLNQREWGNFGAFDSYTQSTSS